MRKFSRGHCPEVLSVDQAVWTERWLARRAEDFGAKFSWPQRDGMALNQHLLPGLKAQTGDHCSYCDGYPVSPPGTETIDHFRPKISHPAEAFLWSNLYFACNHCQTRREQYDEQLLRPDSVDFEFDRYFRWDFTTGEILVNQRADVADQARAEITIQLFRLNTGHPGLRRRESTRRAAMQAEPLDDFAYRGFVGA